MKYKVYHYERYLTEVKIHEYNSINEICNRYTTFCDLIKNMLENVNPGENVEFPYNSYITLKIEVY